MNPDYWRKPSLERLHAAVQDAGFKALTLGATQFRCQCPAHGGDNPNGAQFKLQPSGKITFNCYSQDCSLKSLMDALDLVSSDFYPEELRPKPTYSQHKPRATAADVVAFAKAKIGQGDKLTDDEYSEYRMALLKSAGLVA